MSLVPATPTYTFSSPRPQKFTIPWFLMRYLTKHWSPQVYQKLIKTCKQFFANEKAMVIYYSNKMLLSPNEIKDLQYWAAEIKNDRIFTVARNRHSINLKTNKVWMTGNVNWNHYPHVGIQILIKNVYKFDLTTINLVWQKLTCNDFSKLVDSTLLKDVRLVDTDIYVAKGKLAAVADILAIMPKISSFYFSRSTQSSLDFTSDSRDICEIEALPTPTSLPKLPNLKTFRLEFVTDAFDYQSFISFIKKHPKSQFKLFLVSSAEYDRTFKAALKNKFQNGKIRTEKQYHYPSWVLSNKSFEIRVQSIIT